MNAEEIQRDIEDNEASIALLKKDLELPGLSKEGFYAIANQISWYEVNIGYLYTMNA
jgi:hypothetical protein